MASHRVGDASDSPHDLKENQQRKENANKTDSFGAPRPELGIASILLG